MDSLTRNGTSAPGKAERIDRLGSSCQYEDWLVGGKGDKWGEEILMLRPR